MRVRVLAVLALAACVALAAGWLGGRADASRDSARGGAISFVRGTWRHDRLYFVNADGSGLHGGRTRAGGFPAWSPDGSKLAFYLEGPGARLYVTGADGRGRHPITRPGGYACYWLSWSPDGRRIAYTFNDDCGGFMSVRVVGVDGVGDKRLVPGEGRFDPIWSPDGHTILYGAYLKQQTRLVLVGADGLGRHALTGIRPRSPSGLPTRPTAAWSPNGKHIYFIGADGALWLVNQDGTGRRDLTPKLSVLSFDLSPDGRQIALSAVETPGTRDIYLLRADGTRLRNLTNEHGAMNEDPRWSPDGRLLAFTRRERFGAQADIYALHADGSDRKRLTRSPLDDLAPAWQPAG